MAELIRTVTKVPAIVAVRLARTEVRDEHFILHLNGRPRSRYRLRLNRDDFRRILYALPRAVFVTALGSAVAADTWQSSLDSILNNIPKDNP